MSRVRSVQSQWSTLVSGTTAAIFHPTTRWMSAANVAKLRATVEVVDIGAQMAITRAYQTANVINSPDSFVSIGSAISANGMSFATAMVDVSANTGAKQHVRFGYSVKNTTGTDLNFARVATRYEYEEPS